MRTAEHRPNPIWPSLRRTLTLVVAAIATLAPGQSVASAQTKSWIDVGMGSDCPAPNIVFNSTTNRLYESRWPKVAVIDDATDTVTQDGQRLVSHEVVQMPPGFRFFWCGFSSTHEQGQYLAVDPVTNRIYGLGHMLVYGDHGDVIGDGDLALAVMDGATNAITYVTPFGGEELFPYTGSGDIGVAVNPTTNRIYFAGPARGTGPAVVVVDGATLEVIRRYPEPTWVDPDWPGVTCRFRPHGGVAVNPNTNRVYLTGSGDWPCLSRFLAVIDEVTGEFTVLPEFARSADPINYFRASQNRQVTVDTNANRVFVQGGFSGETSVIAVDEATGGAEAISTWPGSGGHSEGDIAVNSPTRRLYMMRPPDNSGDGVSKLFVVDLVTGSERLAVDFPTGDWPFDWWTLTKLAIDTARNRLYFVNTDFGWIAVVDLGTSEVPSGSNVSVQADAASLTFENVISTGSITVTPIADPSTVGQVPGGFAISDLVAYQITPSQSLVFSGSVTSCFQMPTSIDAATFDSLQVLHMESGTLVDRTSSRDFETRTICATTTTFSPFYVARSGPHISTLYDDTKAHRSGSTVPIKLVLLDASGVNISSPFIPLKTRSLVRVGGNTSSPVIDSGNANPDSSFRYDSTLQGYVFNLSTKGLTPGTWVLSFYALGDESFMYLVRFEVK